jgi:archaellum component FlaF (FlaF/FlaG flagellin family)
MKTETNIGRTGKDACCTRTVYCFLAILMMAWLSNAGAIDLSLSDTCTGRAGTVVEIPITTTDLTLDSIYALEITITYNGNLLSATDVIESGTVIESWGNATFNSFSGGITIVAAGTQPLTGSGSLLLMKFAVNPEAHEGWSTSLVFDTVTFNEGTPVPTTDDGWFTVVHTPAITVSPDTTDLAIGETHQFTVSGDTSLPINWSTTNALVATIDNSGNLTGVDSGTCRVIAEDAGGLTDTTGLIRIRPFALQAPDTSATEGAIFDLPILVTDVTGLSIISGEFTLSYHSTKLNAIDVIETGTLVESWGDAAYNVSGDSITVTMAGSQPLAGSGTLVYVRMQVTPDGSWGCDLKLSNTVFNEDIRPKLHNGYFDIIQAGEIEIRPDTAALTVGDSLQFTVSGDTTSPFDWSTTDTAVATIDQAGLLLTKNGGICKVVIVDSAGLADTSGNVWVNEILVDIPDQWAAPGDTFMYPVDVINDVAGFGIYSTELTLSFNENILHAIGASTTGSLCEGWGAPTVNPSSGQVIVAIAGTTPLSGEGVLLFVEFEVDTGATVGWGTDVQFVDFMFNEGSPTASLSKGWFTVIEVGSEQAFNPLPGAHEFTGIRPNPVTRTAVVNYAISEPVHTTLKVYDISGKSVRTLVNGFRNQARYSVSWNGRDNDGKKLHSGIYFIQFEAGSCRCTKKLLLVH